MGMGGRGTEKYTNTAFCLSSHTIYQEHTVYLNYNYITGIIFHYVVMAIIFIRKTHKQNQGILFMTNKL